ncbi:MAG TPA: Gfo/Idh/MocA family oxidoreductase [Acidimicrobiales bacterium]|nr:Gfo/Idh/MocA family oxidoreductase [Acidimicrobiales bacterium]
MGELRFGVLGAARIAPMALTRPAKENDEVRVVAIASRDRRHAEEFARKRGVERVLDTYEDVVHDPDVDAVYVPLPNGLHARWVVAALAAGKHVLCEKPFTSNAAEAEAVAAAAAAKPELVVMEAFHYRYHPMARRMHEVVAAGELGALRHVEASFCFPLPKFSDIRYRLDLAGGALMDAGCYAVHMVRTLGMGEPTVVSARAKMRSHEVDRAMTAHLRFPAGHTATMRCSMWSSDLLRISARAVGERGDVRALLPIAPHTYHRFTTRVDGLVRRERFARRPTYAYQLDAFCDAVLRGGPNLTPPQDSVANMRVIDDVYRAAGLAPRPSLSD